MNTAADIIVRFQRLLGKAVLFPMGFHISGTPVLAVADGLARGDEKQRSITSAALAEYVDDPAEQERLLQQFRDPLRIAEYFSGLIEQTFDTVGLSIDWSKKFSTGDEAYQRLVQWQFRSLERCGILEQGRYPILYSPSDRNAVGEDDIKDGDVDKVSIVEMSYICFELLPPVDAPLPTATPGAEDCTEYCVVATLRPDAIFGTTNLWAHPDGQYARVRLRPIEDQPTFAQVWVVDAAAVCKLEAQFDAVEVISRHAGRELIGRNAKTPLTGRVVPIAAASFLDPRHGTGLVYSSPGGSPHDFLALKEAQREGRLPAELRVINTVEIKDKRRQLVPIVGECYAADKLAKYGITDPSDARMEECKQELYKEEHYGGVLVQVGEHSGIPIKQAKEKIHAALVAEQRGGVLYEPSRRAETRAAQPVIVARLQGQWFLNYGGADAKAKAMALLDGMEYLPSQHKGPQKGALEWVQRRPCARRRGIGTPLPQDPAWLVEPLSDSTIYQIYYPLVHFLNDGSIAAADLTEEFLDWVYLAPAGSPPPPPTAGSPAAGSHPATFETVRRTCRYWGGIDLRYTAQTHVSNHLAFLIFHYALLFARPDQSAVFHPRRIAIGGLLMRNGEKISKGKGNGIPLIQVREKFGADLYRLYIATGTTFDAEFDFRDRDVPALRVRYETWKKLMFAAKAAAPKAEAELGSIDRWLLSKFYSRAAEYWPAMEAMRFRDAFVSILFEFLKDISYHTRRTSAANTAAVMRIIFVDYVLLMTPAVPHICEEMYVGEAADDRFVSLAAFDRTRPLHQRIDKCAEAIEAIPLELRRALGKELDNIQKQPKLGTEPGVLRIEIVQACDRMFELFGVLSATLGTTRKAKEVMEAARRAVPDADWAGCISKLVPRTLSFGLQPYLEKEAEKSFLLESAVTFLRAEYPDAVISVTDADTVVDKWRVALPGSPAVVVRR